MPEDISRSKTKYHKYLKTHPKEALNNSENYFKVNEVEKDIILSHMYPITKEKPVYAESKVVCICDKLVSMYEFVRYQVNLSVNIVVMFCFNLIK